MKVLTLDQVAFDGACFQLAQEIIRNCKPVALVGVVTGGAVVAGKVHSSLLEDVPKLGCYEVSASRVSSVAKRRINIKYLFRVLPVFVLNFLRVLEYFFLKFTMRYNKRPERNIQINDELQVYLKEIKKGCICVIDDAIDSGATVDGVLAVLKEINPNVEYKVASLVVTQENPLVSPDISLYRNVLIRFPWSNDYRTN